MMRVESKTWMPGSSPGMTNHDAWLFDRLNREGIRTRRGSFYLSRLRGRSASEAGREGDSNKAPAQLPPP